MKEILKKLGMGLFAVVGIVLGLAIAFGLWLRKRLNSIGRPHMDANRVRIDKTQWSPKSRGGLADVFAGDFYEDKHFSCRSCGRKSVFTAEQQQYTYEVKKAYIDQEHVLCETCFRERNKLEAEAKSFLQSWSQDKASMKAQSVALARWKEVLNLLPKYGVPEDTARIRMLEKLLNNAA